MKILIIGIGGIGSWCVHFLCDAIRKDIVQQEVEIWVADGDVVETKNFLYSNFDVLKDSNQNKAKAMASRYAVNPIPKMIKTPNEVNAYDLVVVATDDGVTRKLVYDNARDWIDLRAKGKAWAIYTTGSNPPLNLKKPRGSCQYTERLQRKSIDYGNVMAAVIGHQQVLNKLRGEPVIKELRGSL